MRIIRRNNPATSHDRSGSTLVETAIVLPVFFLLIFAFIEFGHVFMTIHVLNGAAKQAARTGIGDNSTTEKVRTKATTVLSGLLNPTTQFDVKVKDGSTFDAPNFQPGNVDYDGLPDADLANYESRQLFIVRVSVPYDNVSIWGAAGPKWLRNLQLTGMSVMRHE